MGIKQNKCQIFVIVNYLNLQGYSDT